VSPDTPDPARPDAQRPQEPGRSDDAARPVPSVPPAPEPAAPGPPPTGAAVPDTSPTGPAGSHAGTGAPDQPSPPTTGPIQPDGSPTGPGHPWGPAAYQSALELRPEPSRRSVLVTVATVLGVTVLGATLGLLWAALAPATPVVKTAEGAIYAQPQPEQPIAADGWFSLLGLGFGVLAALALWFLLRRHRGPLGLFATVVGALGAAVVAWQVGRRVGLSTYQRLLETAPDGRTFSKPADLRAGGVEWVLGVLPVPYGNLLLPAFAAAVTYTLLAGWSRWPSLRPEPAPDVAGLSWGPGAEPAPTAAPEPPGPGAAEPPRG
jgi:hypothetical protein